jgi:2'-5' RNA ligase
MGCNSNGSARINSFSLVAYVSGSLGDFLNSLRQELVPGCNLQSHVTLLPPRPLAVPPETALRHICGEAAKTPAFPVALQDVHVFEVTSVIYLSIEQGWSQLQSLHEACNREESFFNEPFRYHPHVTLAQLTDPAIVAGQAELARRRWAEYRGERSFAVEDLCFVQATENLQWVDLALCTLRRVAA